MGAPTIKQKLERDAKNDPKMQKINDMFAPVSSILILYSFEAGACILYCYYSARVYYMDIANIAYRMHIGFYSFEI